MENLLFLGVPILKHIRVNDVTDVRHITFVKSAGSKKKLCLCICFSCVSLSFRCNSVKAEQANNA